MPDDKILLLTNDFGLKTRNPEVEINIEELYEAENFYKSKPFANIIKLNGFWNGTSKIHMVNMDYGFYKNKIESNNMEKDYPLLMNYGDTFILGHELDHVYKNQPNKIGLKDSSDNKHFTPILQLEITSDIFGVMFTAKVHDFDLKTTNSFLDELIKYRKNGLTNNGDLRHGTHYALESFKEILNEDPSILETLKNLNLDKLDQKIFDISETIFDSTEKKHDQIYGEDEGYKSNKKILKEQIKTLLDYEMSDDVRRELKTTLKPSRKI